MSVAADIKTNPVAVTANLADSPAVDTNDAHHSRIKSLDGLRTVAFFMVFLFHLGAIWGYNRGPIVVYNFLVRWGFLGVDLFFIMSGFIITLLLMDEKVRNKRINLKLFYQRRILRIWPLYYATLAASVILTFAFAKHNFDVGNYLRIMQKAYLPLCFFVWSIPADTSDLFRQLFYQTRFPTVQSIAIMWSVCIEEQFYLVFPWLVAFSKTIRRLVITIAVAVLVSEICRLGNGKEVFGLRVINIGPLSHVTPLAIGALIAIAHRNSRVFVSLCTKYSGLMLFAASFALYWIFSTYPSDEAPHNLAQHFAKYPFAIVCLSTLLVATLYNRIVSGVLATNLMSNFGKYTYCMYLVHYPILYGLRPFNSTAALIHDNIIRHLLWFGGTFILTFAIAKLSWRFIEKPLASMRSKLVA